RASGRGFRRYSVFIPDRPEYFPPGGRNVRGDARTRGREFRGSTAGLRAPRRTELHNLAESFEAAVGNIIENVGSASGELENSAVILTKSSAATQQLSTVAAAASEEPPPT